MKQKKAAQNHRSSRVFHAPTLLEHREAAGVCLHRTGEIETSVATIGLPVILCGHRHVPRTVALSQSKLLDNPDRVGLPADTMETPVPSIMESGNLSARSALFTPEPARVAGEAYPGAVRMGIELVRARRNARKV